MALFQAKSQAGRGRWKPFVTISWEGKRKNKKPLLGSQNRKLKAVYIDLRKQTDLFLLWCVCFSPSLAPARLITIRSRETIL